MLRKHANDQTALTRVATSRTLKGVERTQGHVFLVGKHDNVKIKTKLHLFYFFNNATNNLTIIPKIAKLHIHSGADISVRMKSINA